MGQQGRCICLRGPGASGGDQEEGTENRTSFSACFKVTLTVTWPVLRGRSTQQYSSGSPWGQGSGSQKGSHQAMEAVKPREVPAVPRTDWKGHFSKESYHWEPGALVRGAPPGERSIPPPHPAPRRLCQSSSGSGGELCIYQSLYHRTFCSTALEWA